MEEGLVDALEPLSLQVLRMSTRTPRGYRWLMGRLAVCTQTALLFLLQEPELWPTGLETPSFLSR